MNLSRDELINILENYADCVLTNKTEILSTLQRIYGTIQGTTDFFNYFVTANYKYDLMDIVKFLAEDQNQTLKEFVNEWLQE